MGKIRAVVFDLDGLLLDTEKIALTTFIDSCREFGFNPDLQIYYKCVGRTFPVTKEILKTGYGKSFPLDAIINRWTRNYQEQTRLNPIPIKPGAMKLLQYLEIIGVKKVVVTSTAQQTALRWLKNTNILRFFDFVLGGDQVQNGKPHPEIYLTACRRLKVESANCLALEDSDNGVLSATNAGLVVIQIPDLIQPSTEVRALGHRIVKSLAEVEAILKEH